MVCRAYIKVLALFLSLIWVGALHVSYGKPDEDWLGRVIFGKLTLKL